MKVKFRTDSYYVVIDSLSFRRMAVQPEPLLRMSKSVVTALTVIDVLFHRPVSLVLRRSRPWLFLPKTEFDDGLFAALRHGAQAFHRPAAAG